MSEARPLHVIAMLRARPGAETELRDLAVGLIEVTRSEPGCLRYELLEDPDDAASLTFVETWLTEAHLIAHLETEHLLHARGRYAELLRGELELHKGFEIG